MREFVFANEHYLESVRAFPCFRPAAGDSVPAIPRIPGSDFSKCPLFIAKIDFNLPKKSINFKISIWILTLREVKNQNFIRNLGPQTSQKYSKSAPDHSRLDLGIQGSGVQRMWQDFLWKNDFWGGRKSFFQKKSFKNIKKIKKFQDFYMNFDSERGQNSKFHKKSWSPNVPKVLPI